jgi:hypothetical protein
MSGWTRTAPDNHLGGVTHGGYSGSVVAGESHKITADVEIVPIQEVNEAWERLLEADVKYRFPIDRASLRSE